MPGERSLRSAVSPSAAKAAAREERAEKRVKTLLTNVTSKKSFENRGNPGVWQALQPLSDAEWKKDLAAMKPSSSSSSSSAHPTSLDASAPNASNPSSEPAAATASASAARPTSRRASKRKAADEEPKMATRSSKRVRAAAAAEPTSTKEEATASSSSSSSNTNKRGRKATSQAQPSSSSSNAVAAAPTTTSSTTAAPVTATAAAPTLRKKTDPVHGANGFHLLHPQHHFLPTGADQSAHLTLTYTTTSTGPVLQTTTYRARGAAASTPINWSSAADMARLNRWTNQYLKRAGVPPLREPVVFYTEREKEWLRAYGQRVERGEVEAGKERLGEAFNARWAGTVIEEGRFEGERRPVRSAESLVSEVARGELFPEGLRKRKRRGGE